MVVAFGTIARAEPTVTVRAEARLELRAESRDAQVVIIGRLMDDLNQPLPRKSVSVALTSPDGTTVFGREVLTDADGRFELTTAGSAQRYGLIGQYDGDDHYPRLTLRRAVDLSRAPVELDIALGEGMRLDLERPSHLITITASGRSGGDDVSIELVDELDRVLGEGRTNAAGTLRLAVPSQNLGAPGAGRLVARSHADARREAATAERSVVRFLPTTLTLQWRRGVEGELEGILRTRQEPLALEAVGVFVYSNGSSTPAPRHVSTTLTDTHGRFQLELDDDASLPSEGRLVARYRSDSPGVGSAQSTPLALRAQRAWSNLSWIGLSLLLCALALLALRRRSPERAVVEEQEQNFGPAIELGAAQHRSARQHSVSGRVISLAGRPLAARITLTRTGAASEPTILIECDGAGSFRTGDLAKGEWTFAFEAPGHGPLTTAVSIPHRGECSALVVRLETWRARALSILRDAFARSGGRPDRWRWTTVHSLRGHPMMARAASEVEARYYGSEEPDGSDVARIEALLCCDESNEEPSSPSKPS